MKARSFYVAAALGTILAGCGGNGGSVTNAGPITQGTGLSEYLPFAANNSWTFASGGKIVDQGSGTLSCSCTYNGGTIEAQELFSTTGAYSGTFYFAKASGIEGSGSPITYLVGTSSDQGSTITLSGMTAASGRATPGLGIMDDSPTSSETFSDGSGDTSTLSNVGQTVVYGRARYIDNATDTASAAGTLSVVFQLARGIGYTSISYNGQTTTLSSFTVSSSSSSVAKRSGFVVRAVPGEAKSFDRAMRSLL